MEISLAMGGRSVGRRSVRCIGCTRRFPAGLAGPGDEVSCPHCGDEVIVGGRAGSARIPRSRSAARVRRPLRVVWRCCLLAAVACASYVLLRDPAKTVTTFEWLGEELRVQLSTWW